MELAKKIFFIIERVTRSKRFWFLVLVLFFILSSSGETIEEGYTVKEEKPNYEYTLLNGNKDSKNKILSIKVDGVIYDERSNANPFLSLQQSETYGAEVKDMLIRASEDKTIKAVILEINSPGGTVTGSQLISDGVTYFREKTKKPVYAHISAQGLSGGYWSAVAADYIISDRSAMVGNIGVILGPFKQYKDVKSEGDAAGSIGTDGGIETTFITAGKYKDSGSPYRPMTDEETKHWQSMVNDSYSLFVQHVSKNRNIPQSTIQDTIKAFPQNATKAKEYNMIDEIGDKDLTIERIAKKANISSDYQVIQQKHKGGVWDSIFSAVSMVKPPQVESTCRLCGKPLFIYMPAVRMQ